MQDAAITGAGTDVAVVTYTAGGNLGILSAGDFTSNPSGEIGTFQVVTGTNELSVQFGASIAGDTSLTYSGNAVGFLTPQTILY